MKSRLVVLLLVVVMTSGCALRSRQMRQWEGAHISAVIQGWGPYDRTSPDGQGGLIYTFYEPRNGRDAERHFYVNEEGIVYSWRWEGI